MKYRNENVMMLIPCLGRRKLANSYDEIMTLLALTYLYWSNQPILRFWPLSSQPSFFTFRLEISMAKTNTTLPKHDSSPSAGYTIPDAWANLSEVAVVMPEENPEERPVYHHRTLEETQELQNIYQKEQKRLRSAGSHPESSGQASAQRGAADSQGAKSGLRCSRCSIL